VLVSPDYRPSCIGARRYLDESFCEEVRLTIAQQVANDAIMVGRVVTGATKRESQSFRDGGGMCKLWIALGLCPDDPARLGAAGGIGSYIIWGSD